ncbi:histidine phosphatase family protein [Bacteroidota bacterium]
MTIGLVRHFKVDIEISKRFYTPAQFNAKMDEYDASPVIPQEVNLNGIDWEVCYSSTIPRAQTTAAAIYKGETIKTDLLKEVTVRAFTERKILLPAGIWHLGGRIAWYKEKKSQPEKFSETMKRADEIIDKILSSGKQNVLCVSHGFFMGVLFRKLYKLGFKGETDMRPQNGKLYLFNRKNQP